MKKNESQNIDQKTKKIGGAQKILYGVIVRVKKIWSESLCGGSNPVKLFLKK